jgi:hypothetical protein
VVELAGRVDVPVPCTQAVYACTKLLQSTIAETKKES